MAKSVYTSQKLVVVILDILHTRFFHLKSENIDSRSSNSFNQINRECFKKMVLRAHHPLLAVTHTCTP
jgi:hypothetical protein